MIDIPPNSIVLQGLPEAPRGMMVTHVDVDRAGQEDPDRSSGSVELFVLVDAPERILLAGSRS